MSTQTAKNISIHDQRRKDKFLATLVKAKEQAEETLLYLTFHDRDPEEIHNVHLALEHIGIALEHLGVTKDDSA